MIAQKKIRIKRTGERKESRRRKIGPLIVPELRDEAPIGTYRVDAIAEKLIAWGVTPSDPREFVWTIRTEIFEAARGAAFIFERFYLSVPSRVQDIERFFKDIELIGRLVERNKKLNQNALSEATRLLPKPVPRSRRLSIDELIGDVGTGDDGIGEKPWDEIDDLLSALHKAAEAIKNFQETRIVRKEGRSGNRDILTSWFIEGIFRIWTNYITIEGDDEENLLFVRFLTAAWRDVGFPTRESEGQDLQGWLYDRVRKHFRGYPGKVYCRRIREQHPDIEVIPPSQSRMLSKQLK